MAGLGLAGGVPLGAADVIDGTAGELADVERVKADLRVGQAVADRVLIAAVHVDRDRPDRLGVLAELVEERLQRRGVAARTGPHDRARAVVADLSEVALPATVADLVNADHHQALQALDIEAVSDDPLDDLTDGVPANPQQRGDRGLGHLLGHEGDQVLKVAGVPRPGPCPRNRLHADAAVRATHAPQLVLDQAAVAGQVEMTPAPPRAVMDLPAQLPAARACRPPAPERNPDRDAGRAEEHIRDTGALQRQQPIECGRDPHAVLPRSLSFENPAACPNDGRAGRPTPAQAPTTSPREKEPAPGRASDLKRSTQTTGDPKFSGPCRPCGRRENGGGSRGRLS